MHNDNHTEADLQYIRDKQDLERQITNAENRLTQIDRLLDNSERTAHSPGCPCILCSIWRIVHTGTSRPSPNRFTTIYPGGRTERKHV